MRAGATALPQEQTYDIAGSSGTSSPDDFAGVFVRRNGSAGMTALAASGTLTFTSVSDGEMAGSFAFPLHQPRLCDPERPSRLLLGLSLMGLSLAHVWPVSVASYAAGARVALPHRPDRPSSPQPLGLRWANRRLRNREPPQMRLQPYVCKLSGS